MTTIRLLLNSGFTGANAFLAIAQAQGIFQAAGLDVEFTPGRGAYTAAQRLAEEGFDAAYGDVNALIELAAQHPQDDLPKAVLMVHQQTPAVISVARAGTIQRAPDLQGLTLLGHASDVALRLFPLFAARQRLPVDAVTVQTADGAMLALLQDMLGGKVAGVFGYATTQTAALAGNGLQASELLRFLRYAPSCTDLYGSALMVSPRLLRDGSEAVQRLVQAVRNGIWRAQADPHAAIAAVRMMDGKIDPVIELERWRGTLADDMLCSGPVPAAFGNADMPRLERAIAALQRVNGWEHRPAASHIVARQFL